MGVVARRVGTDQPSRPGGRDQGDAPEPVTQRRPEPPLVRCRHEQDGEFPASGQANQRIQGPADALVELAREPRNAVIGSITTSRAETDSTAWAMSSMSSGSVKGCPAKRSRVVDDDANQIGAGGRAGWDRLCRRGDPRPGSGPLPTARSGARRGHRTPGRDAGSEVVSQQTLALAGVAVKGPVRVPSGMPARPEPPEVLLLDVGERDQPSFVFHRPGDEPPEGCEVVRPPCGNLGDLAVDVSVHRNPEMGWLAVP